MNPPIFIDSLCFIYLFEQNPNFHNVVRPIFSQVSKGKIDAKTSLITVTEVLTVPYKNKDTNLVDLYQEALLQMPNLELLTPDYKLAVEAAKLRAQHNLKLPDAYQLAMAIESNCKTFLTNDEALKKVKEIKVICLKDLV